MPIRDYLIRCTRAVKYNGIDFEMAGFSLKLPEQLNIDIQIGDVKVKDKLIRAVANLAVILDMAQFSNCLNIKLLQGDSPDRAFLARKSAEIFERLGTLQGIIEIAQIMGANKADKIENIFLQWLSYSMPLAPSENPVAKAMKVSTESDTLLSKSLKVQVPKKFTIDDAIALADL